MVWAVTASGKLNLFMRSIALITTRRKWLKTETATEISLSVASSFIIIISIWDSDIVDFAACGSGFNYMHPNAPIQLHEWDNNRPIYRYDTHKNEWYETERERREEDRKNIGVWVGVSRIPSSFCRLTDDRTAQMYSWLCLTFTYIELNEQKRTNTHTQRETGGSARYQHYLCTNRQRLRIATPRIYYVTYLILVFHWRPGLRQDESVCGRKRKREKNERHVETFTFSLWIWSSLFHLLFRCALSLQ